MANRAAGAAEYYEEKLPRADVAHVLAGNKLDAKLIAKLSTERTLADLKSDLAEIGY